MNKEFFNGFNPRLELARLGRSLANQENSATLPEKIGHWWQGVRENFRGFQQDFVSKDSVIESQPLQVTPQGLRSQNFDLLKQFSVDNVKQFRPQDFNPLEEAVLIKAEQSVLEAPGRQVAYIMTCAPHQDIRFIVTMTRSFEEPDLVYLTSYRLSKDVKSEKADSLLGLLAEKVDGREIKEVTAENGQKASILVIKDEKSFISDLGEIREAESGRLERKVLEFSEPRLGLWPRLELMNRAREVELDLVLESRISSPLFSREPQKEAALQSAARPVVIEPPAKVVPEQKPAKLEEKLKPEEKSPMPLAVETIARSTIRPRLRQPVFFKERTLVLKLQLQPELAVVRQLQQFQTERQALQLWLSAEQGKEKVMEKVVVKSLIEQLRVIKKPIVMRNQVATEPLISVKPLATEAEQPQKSIVVKPEEDLIIISEAPIAKANEEAALEERKQEPEELVIVESVPVVFDWQSPLFRVRARKEQRLPDFKTKEFLAPISFRKDWVWSVKGFEKREDMFLTNLLLHSLTPPVKVLIQAADLGTSLPANQVIFDRQWLETEMIIPVRNTKIIKADEYPEELTVEAGFLELVEKLLVDELEDDYQDLLPFYLYFNEEN